MSIQQNFPAISPSLSLNFARSKTLDPRITFTRTSTATRVNGQGLIEVVSANTPRFDHSYDPVSGTVKSLGLLVEESRSNLITYSEQFDNPVWGNPASGNTITANAITAPDGTTTADLVSNVGQVVSLVEYVLTVPASSTTDYYATIYAKKSTASTFTFNCYYVGNTENNVTFNFDTGAVTSVPYSGEYIFQDVGNGWYRCGFRMTRDSTGTRTQIAFRFWESGRSLTSGNTYFWGAQLEKGSFPTSYIPTTTSTVTRTVDNASIVGENFSSWYNQSEGTIYCDFKLNSTGTARVFNIDDGTSTNRISGLVASSFYQTFINPANAGPSVSPSTTYNFKIASGHQDNNIQIYVNSIYKNSNTSITIPKNLNTFRIGNWQNNTFQGTTISQLTYYPRRLNSIQLQTLTK